MQGNGGTMSVDVAARHAVNTLMSGPAAGVKAAAPVRIEVLRTPTDLGLAGLVQEALGKARENQLIEDGTYPGLEAALDEAEAKAEEEPPDWMSGEPQPPSWTNEPFGGGGGTFSRIV